MWLALNREGTTVARCTVKRLMAELGLAGATRGKSRRTTIADPAAARPADLVQRQSPSRCEVRDEDVKAHIGGSTPQTTGCALRRQFVTVTRWACGVGESRISLCQSSIDFGYGLAYASTALAE